MTKQSSNNKPYRGIAKSLNKKKNRDMGQVEMRPQDPYEILKIKKEFKRENSR